jgi:hypothetical protein
MPPSEIFSLARVHNAVRVEEAPAIGANTDEGAGAAPD